MYDNHGGAFFVWTDDRNGTLDLYAQRVFGPGLGTAWPAAGLAVVTGAGDQRRAAAVPDGTGGLLVFWEDTKNGTVDIYGQHVTEAGALAWGAPRPIAVGAGNQRKPVATPDGEGGAIVGFETDQNGNADVYAGRITASGTVGPGGGYGAGAGDQTDPVIAASGAGGVFLAWRDTRNGNADIYGIHILSSGPPASGWTVGGNALCTENGTQEHPACVSDGTGGVLVAWEDGRASMASGVDVYALRVESGGTRAPGWASGGNALCTATGNQIGVRLVSDGLGGGLVSWEDHRAGSADIYALQVTATGAVDASWTANGAALCEASGDQLAPAIGSDGTGGTFVTWVDQRSGEPDVYAIHVRGAMPVGPVAVPEPGAPGVLRLLAPRPNPAFGRARFGFELPQRDRVDLEILDTAGRRVRALVHAELPPGSHDAVWDGADGHGVHAQPGVYFVRLRSANRFEVRRFVLLQ